jgi:hypothetical protein
METRRRAFLKEMKAVIDSLGFDQFMMGSLFD